MNRKNIVSSWVSEQDSFQDASLTTADEIGDKNGPSGGTTERSIEKGQFTSEKYL